MNLPMQKSDIKLSVLVTFCNQKEFIKDAIESCLMQEYNFPIEILIGLDGECFESERILNEYVEKHDFIKLFKVDNSKLDTINIEKASRNRLNLLLHAQGEYICFLDGDDFYIDKNRFQELVEFLDNKPEYIAVFHDYEFFNNNTKEFEIAEVYDKQPREFLRSAYIKKHKSFSCFVYRNIFFGCIPSDFDILLINDSTLTFYYSKYGKFYYINKSMLGYRIGQNSIYNSLTIEKMSIYRLLCAEINQKTLPIEERRLCQKYQRLLKRNFKFFTKKKIELDDEFDKIKNFAKKYSCYFTYNLLNYKNLDLVTKIQLQANKLKYCVLKKSINCKKYKTIHYYNSEPNFGDELNLYILQRILGINVKRRSSRNAEIFAIGSILGGNLSERPRLNIFAKQLKIWGTGLSKAKETKKEYFKRKVKILALRGEYTKERVENILETKLAVPLGDPGLLASKLVDVAKIPKKYNVGIITHYIDKNLNFEKNIKIDNYKIIDITKNPMYILKEIAECEVVFSSAMHGLIASDSLGIPNQWIKLSNNLVGGAYKFNDYYSVFGICPEPFLLMENELTEEIVGKVKELYEKSGIQERIPKINDDLLKMASEI